MLLVCVRHGAKEAARRGARRTPVASRESARNAPTRSAITLPSLPSPHNPPCTQTSTHRHACLLPGCVFESVSYARPRHGRQDFYCTTHMQMPPPDTSSNAGHAVRIRQPPQQLPVSQARCPNAPPINNEACHHTKATHLCHTTQIRFPTSRHINNSWSQHRHALYKARPAKINIRSGTSSGRASKQYTTTLSAAQQATADAFCNLCLYMRAMPECSTDKQGCPVGMQHNFKWPLQN